MKVSSKKVLLTVLLVVALGVYAGYRLAVRGTDVIGVSLDEPDAFECYDQLAEIYPNLIGCNDLSRLPGQIVGIVAKVLGKR